MPPDLTPTHSGGGCAVQFARRAARARDQPPRTTRYSRSPDTVREEEERADGFVSVAVRGRRRTGPPESSVAILSTPQRNGYAPQSQTLSKRRGRSEITPYASQQLSCTGYHNDLPTVESTGRVVRAWRWPFGDDGHRELTTDGSPRKDHLEYHVVQHTTPNPTIHQRSGRSDGSGAAWFIAPERHDDSTTVGSREKNLSNTAQITRRVRGTPRFYDCWSSDKSRPNTAQITGHRR